MQLKRKRTLQLQYHVHLDQEAFLKPWVPKKRPPRQRLQQWEQKQQRPPTRMLLLHLHHPWTMPSKRI
jgi:hypothetical protein